MSKLKPYQVGENDIVVATSEENAKQVLIDYCGDDFTDEELETQDLSERLDMKLIDEDGNLIDTLGNYIKDIVEPEYLLGWE